MKVSLQKFSKFFTESQLWQKVSHYARQAGLKTTYTVLLLFYAYKRKDTPAWAKRVVMGTLGYFIAPFDLVVDLTPIIGYTDDLSLLSFSLVTVACYINDGVKEQARNHLGKWFGEYDPAELAEVDEQL